MPDTPEQESLDSSPLSDNAQQASVLPTIQRLLDRGKTGVLITVIETTEESGTSVGTKLLCDESGVRTGSLGAEELDQAAVEFAREFLASRENTRVFQGSDFAPAYTACLESRFLFERIQAEPRIVICGAGHVGAALARLASFTGYEVVLIDDRPEFLRPELFPEERIELLATDSWADAVRDSIGNGGDVAVAIVTRGHNEDEVCLRAVMTTTPVYVGLIGSKRRTNIVLDRLREDGIEESKIGRVRAPVGLDIGAVTPEEVALSILAEIIAERRGGKGGSLSAWRRLPTSI